VTGGGDAARDAAEDTGRTARDAAEDAARDAGTELRDAEGELRESQEPAQPGTGLDPKRINEADPEQRAATDPVSGKPQPQD
jgi:hypothetical protein